MRQARKPSRTWRVLFREVDLEEEEDVAVRFRWSGELWDDHAVGGGRQRPR
jgi:hypothetical protein